MTDTIKAAPSLAGKIALVTGGARGLGLEVCLRLAELGAHAIVGARDAAQGEAVAATLRERGLAASSLRLDITREADRLAAREAIERAHGRLDILINNAAVLLDSPDGGTPATRPPSQALPDVLRDSFEANFFAPVFLT